MTMKKHSGFTLVELLMTLVIAAIILTIGFPGLRTLIQRNRITTVNNELVSVLHVARSEAIRQNASACVCPSDDVTQAVPVCSGAAAWEVGVIAFLDINGNCVLEAGAPPDVLLKVWNGSDYVGQMTVRNDNASINATNTIVFNSRGEPQINGVSQQGVFSISDDRGLLADANGKSTTASAVILGVSGQVRTSRLASLITYTAP